jgi:hypothetical protein
LIVREVPKASIPAIQMDGKTFSIAARLELRRNHKYEAGIKMERLAGMGLIRCIRF